jgi:hypothetical protein
MAREVLSRAKWDAKPPRQTPSRMSSTRDGVFIHHSVSRAPSTVAAERAEMRNLQQIAFSRGFNDISYSFIVFPSGRIYEGRGKGVEGAHTLGYNDTAYGLCCAGNYETAKPTDAMVKSLRWLRRTYLNLGDKPCRAHQSVYATACPGKYLKARISEL